jgi:uncharacterized membrane protein YdjX (TVP38/TMEM64 family)
MLLILTFVIAYFLFANRSYPALETAILDQGYLGSFLAGLIYAYAFTAAPATFILLMLGREQSLIFASLIAGVGALISDLLIFHFIKRGFSDEVHMMSEEKLVKRVNGIIPDFIRKYVYLILASVLIASPLPTELGVTLMASATAVSSRRFAIIAYILHTTGIFIILYIGSLV